MAAPEVVEAIQPHLAAAVPCGPPWCLVHRLSGPALSGPSTTQRPRSRRRAQGRAALQGCRTDGHTLRATRHPVLANLPAGHLAADAVPAGGCPKKAAAEELRITERPTQQRGGMAPVLVALVDDELSVADGERPQDVTVAGRTHHAQPRTRRSPRTAADSTSRNRPPSPARVPRQIIGAVLARSWHLDDSAARLVDELDGQPKAAATSPSAGGAAPHPHKSRPSRNRPTAASPPTLTRQQPASAGRHTLPS